MVDDRLHRSKGSVKGLDKKAESIRSQIIKELDECDRKDSSRGKATLKDPIPQEGEERSGRIGGSQACPKRGRCGDTPGGLKKRRIEAKKDRTKDK